LPVGVGPEGDGRVKGQVEGDIAEALGIKGKPFLDELEQDEDAYPQGVENKQGFPVLGPTLLF
jgi:hypothetical protein